MCRLLSAIGYVISINGGANTIYSTKANTTLPYGAKSLGIVSTTTNPKSKMISSVKSPSNSEIALKI